MGRDSSVLAHGVVVRILCEGHLPLVSGWMRLTLVRFYSLKDFAPGFCDDGPSGAILDHVVRGLFFSDGPNLIASRFSGVVWNSDGLVLGMPNMENKS